MTAAVAACRRRKQRIKNINQLALVLGLPDEEDAMVSREHISVAFATCTVQQLRPRYVFLDAVGGRLHSTVCMARCGLPAAFVWLCKPETIEDHVLYHATVASRCTRQRAYPEQQSFALCCGWQHCLNYTVDGVSIRTYFPIEYNVQTPRFLGFE